jgi:hypothetical protein
MMRNWAILNKIWALLTAIISLRKKRVHIWIFGAWMALVVVVAAENFT